MITYQDMALAPVGAMLMIGAVIGLVALSHRLHDWRDGWSVQHVGTTEDSPVWTMLSSAAQQMRQSRHDDDLDALRAQRMLPDTGEYQAILIEWTARVREQIEEGAGRHRLVAA